MKSSSAFDAVMERFSLSNRGIAVFPDEIQGPLLRLKDATGGCGKILLETDVLQPTTCDYSNRNEFLVRVDSDAIGTGYLNSLAILLDFNKDSFSGQIR